MLDDEKIPPSRQPKGTFSYLVQQPPLPLYPAERPITAKENYLRLFRNGKPMWMPIYMSDTQYCWPDVYAEHPPFETTGFDWWGQHWTFEPTIGGAIPTPGYRVISDITKWREEVKFPDLDAVNWAGDAQLQTARYDPDRCHMFNVTEGMFERLHELMPMDEAMVAFYEEPECVKEFFEAMVPYKIKNMELVFRHYAPVDYIIWGDDWGHQRSGFFSNETFREFIMPSTQKCWDWVHRQGKYVEIHSCGLTQQYIEEFIEMGADAWTPQSINDVDMLTEKYGDKISITIWNPAVSEATSAKEARALIRKFVDKYGPRGGKVIHGPIMHRDPEISKAASEEMYYYSSNFYAGR
jgi:hypothetical protein